MNPLTKYTKKIYTDNNVIFIVEDNELYANLLKEFLQIHFPNIKEIKIFNIGELCLMELHRNPSIVIMDYFLNSKYKDADNGLGIIKRIKEKKPKTNIILLSAQNKLDIALDAINLYNCSYVQKNQEEAFSLIEQLIKVFFKHENSQFLSN